MEFLKHNNVIPKDGINAKASILNLKKQKEMKLDKKNVCVFIENESHLQEARELLERYGERLDDRTFYITVDESFNFLKLNRTKSWTLGFKPIGLNKICKLKTQITLTELEEILKGEKDE